MKLRRSLLIALAVCGVAGAAHAQSFVPHRGVGGLQTFGSPNTDPKNAARYAADPYQPHWADAMPRARLDELHAAGFDFLRINIDPGPLFETQGAHISEIKDAVGATLAAGLGAVVDFHFSETHALWGFRQVTAGYDTPAYRHYIETLRAVAQMLAAFPANRVALEVFNEPPPPCAWRDRPDWPQQLHAIYKAARAAGPKLTLLVSGACWASIDGLTQLDASQFDANTIFVFHYYQPNIFTTQGFWGSDKYLEYIARLPYPPDPGLRDAYIARALGDILTAKDIPLAERPRQAAEATKALSDYFDNTHGAADIARDFARVKSWADGYGIPPGRILLGEFGAMKDVYGKRGAAPADRARWLHDARATAERAGFGWSVWALTNTDGIVTGDTDGPLDASVLRALGLDAN